MDIDPKDEKANTPSQQEPVLKDVEIKYCANDRRMSVIQPGHVLHRNIFPPAKASGFGHLSFDPYDLYRDEEEYLTLKRVADSTPRWSDRAACL